MTCAKVNSDLQEEVISWLVDYLGIEGKKISPMTQINLDLGVAGEDGADLMRAFGMQFGIDVSAFPCRRYFGDEIGINPISLLRTIIRIFFRAALPELAPLRIMDLVNLVVPPTIQTE